MTMIRRCIEPLPFGLAWSGRGREFCDDRVGKETEPATNRSDVVDRELRPTRHRVVVQTEIRTGEL